MTPEDVAYLRAKAQAAGYNADDLLRVINYESSGDPTRWGGKGGNYYGLIQFGGPERKQFGVDTEHPNAQNQIDATLRFLSARGFKPGMGLLDLYSTVNAGSPGHYSASDGNGTVASHVAKMMGTRLPEMPLPSAQPQSPMQPAAAPTLSDALTSPQVRKFTLGLLAEPQQPEQSDDMQQQMMEFHQRAHQAALQGLLGGAR